MKTRTTCRIRSKGGREIPRGSEVEVTPYNETSCAVIPPDGGRPIKVPYVVAHQYLKGFRPPPPLQKLIRYVNDGVSPTPTGYRVEPDGVGPDGIPSWALILGYI